MRDGSWCWFWIYSTVAQGVPLVKPLNPTLRLRLRNVTASNMIFTSRQICVKRWHQQGPYPSIQQFYYQFKQAHLLLNPQKCSRFLQGEKNTCSGKTPRVSPGHYLTSLFLPRTNPPSFSRYQRATLINSVPESAWERPTEAGLPTALPVSFLDSTAHFSKGCDVDTPHPSVFFIPK